MWIHEIFVKYINISFYIYSWPIKTLNSKFYSLSLANKLYFSKFKISFTSFLYTFFIKASVIIFTFILNFVNSLSFKIRSSKFFQRAFLYKWEKRQNCWHLIKPVTLTWCMRCLGAAPIPFISYFLGYVRYIGQCTLPWSNLEMYFFPPNANGQIFLW